MIKSQSTMQSVPTIDINIDTVYIRTNIKDIHTKDIPVLWEYDEIQLTKDEYFNLVGSYEVTAKELKLVKIYLLDGKCSGSIYQGLDINSLHYNFTPTSQTNLETIARLITSGQKSFLYRADNEPEQRVYTDTEMNTIIRAKEAWITVNTNYYELLKTWINRENNTEILNTIDYGTILPQDLMLTLKTRCEAIGIDISKYMIIFAEN